MTTPPVETKTFDLKASDDDTGQVEAVVATLNVVDKLDDITRKGFFGHQDVSILVAHNTTTLPVGKGAITETDSEAVFSGRFNLKTSPGQDAYESVKFMGGQQEWSYGYRLKPDGWSPTTHEGRSIRELHAAKDGTPGAHIFEVSPVPVAAGERTRTLQIKSAPTRFVDQVNETVEAVQAVIDRADDIIRLRADKGSTLGVDSVKALEDMMSAYDTLRSLMAGLHKQDDDEQDDAHTALIRQAAETAAVKARLLTAI